MRCDECRFWEKIGAHFTPPVFVGLCKRNPPQICHEDTDFVNGVEYMHGLFPLTTAVNWCGEFQQRPPESTVEETGRRVVIED